MKSSRHKVGKHKRSLLNMPRLEHATLSQSIQKGKTNNATCIYEDEVASPSIAKGNSKLSHLKMSRWANSTSIENKLTHETSSP